MLTASCPRRRTPGPRRGAAALLVGVALLASGACSSDADPVADQAPASTSPPAATPTPSTPTPSTPTAEASSEAPSSAPPSPVAPSPSVPAPTASATGQPTLPPTKAPGPSKALRSVRKDVASIAPQLEAYYRDREYPVDLDQVRQTLTDSGVVLSPGNEVGGYTYDGDAVEFVLCIQNSSGAWADYDTSPMALQESGETGGCP